MKASLSCITIATRQSPLALWQANFIANQLKQYYPNLEIKLLGITTQGDRILEKSLAKIGGKRLFIKELEAALIAGQADIAVHSLKDMPADLPAEFTLAAIPKREDAHDAFVSLRYPSLSTLPENCIIGTSSLRRASQLRRHLPQCTVKTLRGNLQTRLKKLDNGEFDAIILAAAGLKRLGLADRIRAKIPTEIMLPAIGQGALGVECLTQNQTLIQLLAPLNDPHTTACIVAERAMNQRLQGSCQTPIGGYCTVQDNFLRLRGLVASCDGSTAIFAEANASMRAANGLGIQVADLLLMQGARSLLTPDTTLYAQ